MIVGIGTDIVSVVRIQGMLDRHGDAFCVRHFTEHERAWCDAGRGGARAERYAARFAAKEAAAKALGCGLGPGAGFHDIEIVRDFDDAGRAVGRPRLHLSGAAAATAGRLQVTHTHVTLAHERDVATATVVLEAIPVSDPAGRGPEAAAP